MLSLCTINPLKPRAKEPALSTATLPSSLRPRRVLLTGFGPFPGMPNNPTAALVAAVDGWEPHSSGLWRVTSAVFATEWQGLAERRRQTLAKVQPDVCLHLGVHGKATGLHVETTAHNALEFGRPDAAGLQVRDARIAADGPATWQTRFAARQVIQELLQADLPALESQDPGRYLCNALYALALQDAKAAPALFLHIPMPGQPRADGKGAWTMEQLQLAVHVTILALLRQV